MLILYNIPSGGHILVNIAWLDYTQVTICSDTPNWPQPSSFIWNDEQSGLWIIVSQLYIEYSYWGIVVWNVPMHPIHGIQVITCRISSFINIHGQSVIYLLLLHQDDIMMATCTHCPWEFPLLRLSPSPVSHDSPAEEGESGEGHRWTRTDKMCKHQGMRVWPLSLACFIYDKSRCD